MSISEMIKGLSELRTDLLQVAVALRTSNPQKSYEDFERAQICEQAVNELTRNEPKEMEIDGGNTCWWFVCPECHGAVDRADHFCRHCGQAVK